MEIDSSDFIAQGADSAAQWSRETQYFLLSRQQVGGRLLLRKSLKPQFLDDSQLRETLRKEYELGTIVGMDTDYVVNYYQMVDAPEECYLTMGMTNGFSAPEQQDGTGDVDARTDIYTVGLLLKFLKKN